MSKYNITENRKKYQLSHFTQSVPVLLLCLIVLGFLSKGTWNAYVEKERSVEGAMTAKLELAKLEERQAFVSAELEKMSTDEGREAKLREKFGVGRPGEQVAIIVEAENNDDGTLNESDFWARIKNFFSVLFQK